MGKVSAVELCQKLKDESEASQDNSAVNNLRIRICRPSAIMGHK